MTDEEKSLYYAERLGRMIRCETISQYNEKNTEKFERFHELIYNMFPKLFENAVVENFDGSLLIKVSGRTEKKPLMLMSHHDVVEATGKWSHEPFSGELAEGKVWGRGTLDTKGSLWAMLEALNELCAEGYVPERDIYIESACTEETDGSGADKISLELQKRGIELYMTLDEGGMIMYDPIGGADAVFAMMGVGEKGCTDIKFIARSNGGHASTPGKNTPLVRLGKFMAAAEKSNIFKAELSPVVREMFLRMSPYVKKPLNLVFANTGKMKRLLTKALPMISPTAGAMLKTTLAFTMASGSDGNNVLPQEAYVIGNMRSSHHQGIKDSLEKITKLAKKFDIETEILDPGFESALSDYNSEGFKLVENAVREVFPGVVPTPYVMTGASDSRYFSRVTPMSVRFAPFLIDEQQLASIHGIDENVDASALIPAVEFYKYIIRNC